MKSAKNEKKEKYFYEYTNYFLEQGENIDNFIKIKQEYADAYKKRKEKINNLYDEIKKIKNLKM